MANCFDAIENESLDSCINTEIAAGVSEVGVYFAVHGQALVIPEPPAANDAASSNEEIVTVTADITFPVGKGFAKITVQADSGEVTTELVGNPGNKKHKEMFMFGVPGNSKKLLGHIRRYKNVPMIYLVTERDGQKRLIGDKNNPAYMTEVKGTTGKGGEDDKIVNFTISAYSIPVVYEGIITLEA